MSRSRISILFLLALAQPFAAANAFAESPCPPIDQKPDSTDNCEPPPPPPPPDPSTKADLVPKISSVSFAGGKVTVAMSIGNQGKAVAGQTKARVALFKQQGSGFASTAFQTQDVPVATVQPSAASSLSAETPSVPGFGPKNYKICVTADALQQVQENSEGNNTTCQQFLIHVPGPVAAPGTLPAGSS